MAFTEKVRGDRYCPECGSPLRWVRLLSGRWIAVEPQPVLYIPGGGRKWLVSARRYDADILKDCEIWKPGMIHDNLQRGYIPHLFTGCGRGRR